MSHLTYSTAVVLAAIGSHFRYGFDIMDATGLPSGTVYPILRRLERNGWLRSAWEDEAKAHGEQRPARRYYELTRAGSATLAEAQSRFRGLDRLFAQAPEEAAAKEAHP
jgi:DNA-binding PadR family transcriptional regulator